MSERPGGTLEEIELPPGWLKQQMEEAKSSGSFVNEIGPPCSRDDAEQLQRAREAGNG